MTALLSQNIWNTIIIVIKFTYKLFVTLNVSENYTIESERILEVQIVSSTQLKQLAYSVVHLSKQFDWSLAFLKVLCFPPFVYVF